MSTAAMFRASTSTKPDGHIDYGLEHITTTMCPHRCKKGQVRTTRRLLARDGVVVWNDDDVDITTDLHRLSWTRPLDIVKSGMKGKLCPDTIAKWDNLNDSDEITFHIAIVHYTYLAWDPEQMTDGGMYTWVEQEMQCGRCNCFDLDSSVQE